MTEERPLYTDSEIVKELALENRDVFEYLFRTYYSQLCRFSMKYVRQKEATEEIVQDIFLYLWEKRHTLNITQSLKAYLYTAVRNRSLNHIKANMNRVEMGGELSEQEQPIYDPQSEALDPQQLRKEITKAIEMLPPKCRAIFDLSKNAGLTYQEIAEELDISKKTVEAQMSIALKKLRQTLQPSWNKIALMLAVCLFV